MPILMMTELFWSRGDGQDNVSSKPPSPSCPLPRISKALRILLIDITKDDIDDDIDDGDDDGTVLVQCGWSESFIFNTSPSVLSSS